MLQNMSLRLNSSALRFEITIQTQKFILFTVILSYTPNMKISWIVCRTI